VVVVGIEAHARLRLRPRLDRRAAARNAAVGSVDGREGSRDLSVDHRSAVAFDGRTLNKISKYLQL
jgi:hypothetical protein